MSSQTEVGKQLLKRRADLEDIVSENKIVEDVLSGRSAIIGRTSRKSDGVGNITVPLTKPLTAVSQAKTSVTGVGQSIDGADESRYLPRHQLESGGEYTKRLQITPFDAETPRILQSRLGAMFRKPPDIKFGQDEKSQPDVWAQFLQAATVTGMSLLDVIVKIAEVIQVGGFGGVLVDREILPKDINDRAISQADVTAQGLGRVIFAPYAAHQICDYASDRHGLMWVKLVERHQDYAATWDAKPQEVYTVRIVDRLNITVYDVKKKQDDYEVSAPVLIPHNCVDRQGKQIVPFKMFNPFPARDGIGRSNLRSSADYDVAAIRVLSDWLFLLHQMAPLLVLKTRREAADLNQIGLGSSYLNVIQNKGPDGEAEELAYVQLDPTAADKLKEMFERLIAKAQDASNKSADVGVSGPVEQSGISKAWTFKTGEERVLFLLAHELQNGFAWLLDLAARNMSLDGTQTAIAFPDSYDVTGMPEQLTMAEQAAALFSQFNCMTPVKSVLRRVGMQVMHRPGENEIAAFETELQAVQSPEQQLLTQAVQERVAMTEGDGV